MPSRAAIRIASRRDVLAGASAAAAFAVLAGYSPAVSDEVGSVAPHSQAFKDLFRDILGEATPSPQRISLDLPEYAENGNGVSFTLAVESPMTEADHVRALHLLSTANPHPHVATYRLTPACGRAQVTGRMRLASTQDVFAVAELSDGSFLVAERTVEVTIGGCR